MKWIWLLLTVAWLAFFALGFGQIPAPARLLDLHSGLWSHHSHALTSQTLKGLKNPVVITWDKAGVPHFFAENEADLYRAQGFTMASQRLFQMDLSTRHISGRLSEWVGDRALESDRFFVSFGMRQSAEKTLAKFTADPKSRMMLESFVDGINSYIGTLKELPPEYTLLGVRPQPFTPINVIYMDKSLTFGLAGRSFGTLMTALQQKLGTEKVLDLFPEYMPSDYEDYVMPETGKKLRAKETAEMFPFISHLKNIPIFPLPNPGKGSNNWAVGPARSTTGHSILANDTHLNYSLPNVWYESQLTTPGFNVYGVSLISVPGIVNGFNGKTAWGPTNGTTPVLDWFEVEFENETSLRYKHQDQWLEPEVDHVLIARKGEKPLPVDVVWTRLGPLMHREGRYGLVANWMGHRPGQELQALRGLYETTDFRQCLKSFTDNWSVPIQNFVCADQDHVSILHAGFVPKRAIGEGRFVMDGTTSRDTLAEAIPNRDHPLLIDPPTQVLSANQKVEGPSYPYYLGWDYEEPFRGKMIRRRLTEKAKYSPVDMMNIQNDNHDLQAEMILPWLLRNIKVDGLTSPQQAALKALREWDFAAVALRVEPALYKAWFSALKIQLSKQAFQMEDPVFSLRDMRIAWFLKRVTENPQDSDRQWLTKPLPELVTQAFQTAWTATQGTKTWEQYNAAELPHVARLPGWGSGILPMDGSGESVRGNHGRHGPVYKTVIALGEHPQAWIQVPGGNEGDPLNPNFERAVRAWSQGEMREVEYYQNVEEARSKAEHIVELVP